MNRQSGTLLIELVLALSVLTVGLLGFMSSFSSNFSAAEEINQRDGARAAHERTVETLRSANFSSLYQDYQYAYLEDPDLEPFTGTYTYTDTKTGELKTASYSVPAYSYVYFYTNEFALPSYFGPVIDLDGSGAKDNTNCTTGYKMLPALIYMVYGVGNRIEVRERYVLISG